MKQEDLARELNVARTAISKYERGDLDLSSAAILRLCEIFSCTADYLLGRSPVPSPDLDPQEEALVLAWRRSDLRAKRSVMTDLEPFWEDAGASAPTA